LFSHRKNRHQFHMRSVPKAKILPNLDSADEPKSDFRVGQTLYQE